MIRHLKFVADMMLCKNSRKELEIVGFGCGECVRELLCFGVLFGNFLLVSRFRNVNK
jgi:hypothetical protein